MRRYLKGLSNALRLMLWEWTFGSPFGKSGLAIYTAFALYSLLVSFGPIAPASNTFLALTPGLTLIAGCALLFMFVVLGVTIITLFTFAHLLWTLFPEILEKLTGRQRAK